MVDTALTIELCGLCPVEPACERKQMLEHFGAAPADGQPPHTVRGQPYRCWLLSLLQETGEKSD
jgi:hypothetical protein